jgi:hypothetical protein
MAPTPVKEVKYTPMPPEMHENCEKMGDFAHFLFLNRRKCRFSLKSTRHTPELFFEEYIGFRIFCYLRHCGVIPVQSFRSHIRPQPLGLGLNSNNASSRY